ncbi:hypothetical protein Tco_1233086 [Tanacetum coccineum]
MSQSSLIKRICLEIQLAISDNEVSGKRLGYFLRIGLRVPRFTPYISVTLLSVTSGLHSASNLDEFLNGFMNGLWTSELVVTNLGLADSNYGVVLGRYGISVPALTKSTKETRSNSRIQKKGNTAISAI